MNIIKTIGEISIKNRLLILFLVVEVIGITLTQRMSIYTPSNLEWWIFGIVGAWFIFSGGVCIGIMPKNKCD